MPNNQAVSSEIPVWLALRQVHMIFVIMDYMSRLNILTRAAVNLSNVSHIEISSLRFAQTLGYTVFYKNKALWKEWCPALIFDFRF